MYAENYKNEVMAEDFRQDLLLHTSAQTFHLNETKKPTQQAVNESFRKLTVN